MKDLPPYYLFIPYCIISFVLGRRSNDDYEIWTNLPWDGNSVRSNYCWGMTSFFFFIQTFFLFSIFYLFFFYLFIINQIARYCMASPQRRSKHRKRRRSIKKKELRLSLFWNFMINSLFSFYFVCIVGKPRPKRCYREYGGEIFDRHTCRRYEGNVHD